MSEFWSGLSGAGIGAGLVGFLFFVMQESLKSRLQRDVDNHVELLKFHLQREALKAELSTRTIHDVYPRLMEKLRIAEAALRKAIDLEQTDCSGFDEDDCNRLLQGLQVPGAERKLVLDEWKKDPTVGVAFIHSTELKYLSRQAKSVAEHARDFAVSQALYLSNSVRALALRVAESMAGASYFSPKPDNQLSNAGHEAATALIKLIESNLDELQKQMISEMEFQSPEVKR